MRDMKILRELLQKSLPNVHAKRLDSVLFGVRSLLEGQRLSLTAIGRSAKSRVAPKHNIKRIDRLLGNTHLHGELRDFFAALAVELIGPEPPSPVIILVDWTRLEDTHCALTAAIPVDGRAIPIYWEVYEARLMGYQGGQKRFVKSLAAILPSCEPIVVTDAGFGSIWFDAVEQQGWDWVVRLSRAATFISDSGRSVAVEALYRTASDKVKDLGSRLLFRHERQRPARLVMGKKWKRPKRKKPNSLRRDAHGRLPAKRLIQRWCDPWVVATSAQHFSAEQTIAIYATRMQIEEAYRDAKNHRFGWSLRHARTSSCERFSVLLLLGTLATFAVTVIGQAAEMLGFQRRYQANTIKRRVLSLFVLGNWALHHDEFFLRRDYEDAVKLLRNKAFRHTSTGRQYVGIL